MKPKVFLVGLLSGCFLAGISFAGVSSKLPHVTREMEKAEFWIERAQDPEKPLLTLEEILRLNHQMIPLEPSAVDVTTFPETLAGSELRRRLREDLKPFRTKSFYTWDSYGENIAFGTIELELLKNQMRLKEIPEQIHVRFGLLVQNTDLRSFPDRNGVFEQKRDRHFDLAQQTRLSVATPVAVLWEDTEGRWVYLVSSLLQGWVERPSVAFFENLQALRAYLAKPFLVVTAPQLQQEEITSTTGLDVTLAMGTVLHGYRKRGAFYGVDYPIRGDDGRLDFQTIWISTAQGIRPGFLPLTRANILRQACALEGTAYGWGGVGGGHDCSSFLQDVFRTMGVLLPRNSGPQSKVGKILATFPEGTEKEAKLEELSSASPAVTFLKLDGHVMLYLGKAGKRHYAIHATSGYQTEGLLFWHQTQRIMSVVVSDLSLGKGSRRGSLLERMESMNMLTEDTTYGTE